MSLLHCVFVTSRLCCFSLVLHLYCVFSVMSLLCCFSAKLRLYCASTVSLLHWSLLLLCCVVSWLCFSRYVSVVLCLSCIGLCCVALCCVASYLHLCCMSIPSRLHWSLLCCIFFVFCLTCISVVCPLRLCCFFVAFHLLCLCCVASHLHLCCVHCALCCAFIASLLPLCCFSVVLRLCFYLHSVVLTKENYFTLINQLDCLHCLCYVCNRGKGHCENGTYHCHQCSEFIVKYLKG